MACNFVTNEPTPMWVIQGELVAGRLSYVSSAGVKIVEATSLKMTARLERL